MEHPTHHRAHGNKRREKQFEWERGDHSHRRSHSRYSHSRNSHSHRHYRHSDQLPPSLPHSSTQDSLRIREALPSLLHTLQLHQASQARKPHLPGPTRSEVLELMAAQLQLKSFVLKLAVDIDDYFVDHHNQLNCEAKVKLWKTQDNERVSLYHCVLHVDERRGTVHALDILEFTTQECPCALRLCHQKNH